MKRFIVLILIGTIFFLGGMTVGSFAVKTKTKDYFNDIIKTYNPAAAILAFNYQGTLNKLSNSEMVLTDINGRVVTISLNNEMKKKITYQDFISHRTAEKSDFNLGSKVLVSLSTNWITGKINSFSLGLQPGN